MSTSAPPEVFHVKPPGVPKTQGPPLLADWLQQVGADELENVSVIGATRVLQLVVKL